MTDENPTVEQLEIEVLQKIKEFQFEADDSLVAQSIFFPIYARYEGDISNIIGLVIESMKAKGYIVDKGNSSFLTQSGYEASQASY